VAERKKTHRRWNDKKRHPTHCGVKTRREPIPNLAFISSQFARHRRKFRRRNRHTEQADRKQSDCLCAGQQSQRTSRQQACEDVVDIGAQLDNSSADENRNETCEYSPYLRRRGIERKAELAQQT